QGRIELLPPTQPVGWDQLAQQAPAHQYADQQMAGRRPPVRPSPTLQSVMFRHPGEARAAGIALVTEDRKRLGLFAAMNVGENLPICTLRETGAAGFINRTREWQMAAATSQQLGVKTAGLTAPITSLSGGNQQKCIIGRWLQTQPQILLLDDPTRGVDVGAKAELYRLMDRLCREGLGIIVTSSELPELLTVCDRILVLCEGRLTGHFSRAEATEQRIMEAATDREGEKVFAAGP